MAVSPELRGILSVVNRASGPLRTIMTDLRLVGQRFLEAGEHGKEGGHRAGEGAHEIAEGAHHAEQAVEHLGHSRGFLTLAGHVRVLRGHLFGLNANLGEISHSLTEFVPALGGLALAGGFVGLVELTEKVAEARSELGKTARILGITTPQFEALTFAAKMTDVPVDTMRIGLEKLNRTIGEALSGKSKDAVAIFRRMHIALRDTHGQVRSVTDILPQMAEALSKTHSAALRTFVATKLLGRAGAELLPLLLEGKEGYRELAEQAREVNYAPSDEENEGLEAFHRNQIGLTAAVAGFRTEIGAKLAPVLAPVLKMAQQWVVANRDWIATGLAEQVEKLVGWVKQVDWRGVINGTTEWAHSTLDLVERLGGLRTVIGAVLLVMGSPLLAALRSIINSVLGLASAGRYLVVEILWPMVYAFGAMTAGLFASEGAWAGLTAAMAANPFGAAMIAIAALGAAVYELYEHWDAVGPYFTRVWDAIVGVFERAWNTIKPIVDAITESVRFVTDSLPNLLPQTAAPNGDVGTDLPNFPDEGRAPLSLPRRQLPSAYPGAGAQNPLLGPAGSHDGTVHIQLDANGFPPGTTVRARSTGAAAAPTVRTGQSLPAGAALAR